MFKQVLAAAIVATAVMGVAAQTPPADDAEKAFRELKWLPPGAVGDVAGKAQFKTSADYTFLAPAETDKFLKLNGNPPQGSSVTIAPTKGGNWFGVLRFAPEGYIKDDEKIDADALLKSLKEGNAEGNEEKRKQGYRTLTLEGWALPPRYDRENRRLEWGTLLRTEDNTVVANVSTRILGRSGYTSAVLVTSPQTLDADLQDFKKALAGFDYVSGEKYSEWREGDKVAAYGLGALVLGGAAAAVSSKGGFKVIGLALLAAAGAVWAAVKKLFGRKAS
jgi:uncharacterized membrane-anchored protein